MFPPKIKTMKKLILLLIPFFSLYMISQNNTNDFSNRFHVKRANKIKLEVKKFPNSFSPNDDGVNDEFKIDGLATAYPKFILTVYNRYGSVVHKYANGGSTSPIWWDGTSNKNIGFGSSKKLVPAGTYWYVIDFNDNQTPPYQGWLYLNK